MGSKNSDSHGFTVFRIEVHGIFASNMVLQRDKPIMVWG